jgi:deazaflavin-dependent oxidoreductase (nitroreductase family)
MPLPSWLARFNRRATNRVARPLARWLPGFGVVVHTGRASQRRYRTPVNVFRHGDEYVIALTYGSGAQWVRNVLAQGGCTLETRGRALPLSRPRVVHDPLRRAVPAVVRVVLGALSVSEFLLLAPGDGVPSPASHAADRAAHGDSDGAVADGDAGPTTHASAATARRARAGCPPASWRGRPGDTAVVPEPRRASPRVSA